MSAPIVSRREFNPARHRARGQAVVWLLGTMAVAGAVMFGVYNVSQLATAKEKTVNAADAAALAGATVEARLLNLVAYNNRSMVANEVFLAQVLSLEAWLGYARTTSDNLGTVLEFVPYLEEVGVILKEAADFIDEARSVTAKFEDGVIFGVEAAKKVFQTAHRVVVPAGALLARNAAGNVADANRAQFKTHQDGGVQVDERAAMLLVTFALNEKRWNGFTHWYADDERGDAKQVLVDSLDAFTANRPGRGFLNFDVWVAGGEKRGGSKLVDYDRWESEDTYELWTLGLKGKDYAPIGWGRANADDEGNAGNTWSPNRLAQDWAYEDGSSHSHDGWSGVPALYDVQDKSAGARRDLHLDYLVAVRRPQANTLTTSQIPMGVATANVAGSSEMTERLQGNELEAFGKATVFFERPQRGLANDITGGPLWRPDGAKEYGSLFSPYWQARVADVTQGEKLAMMGAAGADPLLVKFTPSGQTK